MRFGRTLLVVTATGIFGMVSSCKDVTAPSPVATISLSVYSASLVPSETVLITAIPREAGGTPLTRPITWTTSAAAVATVENGLITGHSIGAAVISAESEGVKADVSVSVDDGGIITPGGNVIYAFGGQVALDFPAASVSQSSRIVISQPQLAAFTTRLIPGTAVSVHTDVPISQPALLIIKYDPTRILGTPESGLRLYQATPTDWQPVNGSTVDINSKTVRGRISASGVYAIFAQAKVGSVTVSPATPALKVGESAAFSAKVVDEDGKPLTDRAVAWSTSAPEVLQIDGSSGAVQAKSPGSSTVTATSEGKSASTTVSVSPGSAANVAVVAGDGQSADTSRAVATAPSVKVTDQAGFAVEGAIVTFAVGVGAGSISPATVASNASGTATADKWTLGNVAGTNTVTATLASGASVVFTATATQPPPPTPPPAPPAPTPPPAPPPAPVLVPAIIAIANGEGQSAPALSAVPISPAAKVTTATGVPVPGVTVTFSIRSGGGSVSGESATTDSLGVATVGKWTLGSGGGNSLFAAAPGLIGSPLIFVATATTIPTSPPPLSPPPSSPPPSSPPPGPTAGPPVAMAIYAGDGQNAAASSSVSVPPSVRVTDAVGVGVPGVVVTFSIRSGGGSISGEVVTTNSQGVATLGQWRLGGIGGQSLFAASPGLTGSPLIFTAVATGAVRIITFGDSNTDIGWSGTNPALVASSYVSPAGSSAGPNNNNLTQLAGKIEAKWRAQSSVSFTAVNHGIAGSGTGTGRDEATGAPHAREVVDGVTRFAGEVLGAGYPWSGGESKPYYFPNGPVKRVAAFVPGPNDFVYVSMGTNDTNYGIGAEQTASNLNWMIDQWVAAGRSLDHFILTTLAPKQNSSVAMVLVNQQIRQIAATRGVYLIDLALRTSDNDGLTWRTPTSDNVGDNLHYSEAVRDWIAAKVVAYMLTKAPR